LASAREMIVTFLNAEFLGAERYLRRLEKIKHLENK
jgi:ribose 5-phosphate isomerase RpiB